jgi:iron complex transport system ATP-binding protein
VPQAQLGLFPFTVRDVVLMGRTAHIDLFATPSAQDQEVAAHMLDLLGIAQLADQPYTEVSGGKRQITLVARALAQEPKILVMDEPTASLDFGNQVRVLSEIKALARRGIAVILSTHDPDQAFLCAHRVAILHKGRLAHVGSPQEVITAETLRTIYGVDVEIRSVQRDCGGALRFWCALTRTNPIPAPRLSTESGAHGPNHRSCRPWL